MVVDRWSIPEAWSRGISAGNVKYVGAIRVWPLGDSDFAVVAHHVEELSMCAYYGECGVLYSRTEPQRSWDLDFLGMMADRVRSLPVKDGRLTFINAAFRGLLGPSRENPFLVVHVPSMRLSAIRFVQGWRYAPMLIEHDEVVFLHEQQTGPLPPGESRSVRVPLDDLEWTEYEARPRARDAADAWFFGHAMPRDRSLVTRAVDQVRASLRARRR